MSDRLVRPRRTALVAGAVVAFYVAVLFGVSPVPDRVVALLGGPSSGVDRLGGLRVWYRPAPDQDVDALAARLASRSRMRREGDLFVLEIPAVGEDQAGDIRAALVAGGLLMKEALETDHMAELAGANPALITTEPPRGEPAPPEAVVLSSDYWRTEDGDAHRPLFLTSHSREALERVLAAGPWRPTTGTEIAFERIESDRDARNPDTYWRTYELASEVLIDGNMIASARGSFDTYTNRPIVLLDFTSEGGDRFCEVTGKMVGHKLATILGGRVRSAPIINGKICGGRASITMGGSDPQKQIRERDALVAVLAQGGLPAGGSVERSEWFSPPDVRPFEWAGRGLLAVVAGVLFALLTAIVIRIARPTWCAPASLGSSPTPAVAAAFPVRRLLVTLLAPVALIGLPMVTLPGINEFEFAHILVRGGRGIDLTQVSVIALGIMPLLTAFALVELVALAIPPLNKLRHSPRGRVPLGKAVAGVALGLALVQGYFVAVYLEALSRGGAEVVTTPGLKFRLLIMGSLATGTMLLAVVAGMIREHGLGNGYGVLLVTGWILSITRGVHTSHTVVELAALVAIAVFTVAVLRWRIGGEREVQLRLPSSGLTPLNDAGGVLVLLVSTLGLGLVLGELVYWLSKMHANTALIVGIAAVLVPVWSWLYARPSLVAPLAARAALAPPTLAMWGRATLLSAVFIVTAGVVGMSAGGFADPILVIIATAVVLDVLEDARAHRRRLEPAWVLHQIQHASVIERTLIDAGIPCHLHASHLRTLLAFFGPFAPVIVLVPADLASEARIKIAALFE